MHHISFWVAVSEGFTISALFIGLTQEVYVGRDQLARVVSLKFGAFILVISLLVLTSR